MTKSKIVATSITTILLLGFSMGQSAAYALPSVNFTVSDQISCEDIGGTWDATQNACHITGLTIPDGETLTIAPNVFLVLNDNTIENFGTIENNGNITNNRTINNCGTLNNNATIDNFGTINNGGIFNSPGTFNNYTNDFNEITCSITVQIDIKPGSDPNCFNNDGNGVIPVAILGHETFDVTQIDPTSISLDGSGVKIKGNSDPQVSLEDVNNDGYEDMVVKIIDTDGTYEQGTDIATLNGSLFNETSIEGTDSICIT